MEAKRPREDKSPSRTEEEQSAEEERTEACPNCDAAGIRRLTVSDKTYFCRRCGHHFDEPTEREVYLSGSTEPTSPGPRALLKADPDAVGGEGA